MHSSSPQVRKRPTRPAVPRPQQNAAVFGDFRPVVHGAEARRCDVVLGSRRGVARPLADTCIDVTKRDAFGDCGSCAAPSGSGRWTVGRPPIG